MTADEARKKLFSMMREDECHAKTLVNHYADQFESLRQQTSKSRKDEFLHELDGRKEVCNRHECDEMIENKMWQHEDTGRLTTCAIRPGNRWHEVGIATDCEHEDLTGKTCAENKPTLGYKDAYEVASSMAKSYLADTNKLRSFAQAIMEAWPEGGIEGDDLQDIAVKHGMLAPETRFEPCGEWCNCNAGVDVDGGEWERGVECYRRTELLTGESE